MKEFAPSKLQHHMVSSGLYQRSGRATRMQCATCSPTSRFIVIEKR
jgi:hypothetical protein